MSTTIHPTAIVDPKAQLGQDVEIGPYCIVEDNVQIGDGTRVDAFAQVKKFTTIGKNNHIHSYAYLGGEPQHLGFKGEETYVRIGDDNLIREYVTIHRGTEVGHGYTSVGSGCMFMAYVHIAHDCRLGNKVIMANAASLAGHVDIGDGVVINGMTGIHQFVRIGDYAFLGAMGGFTMDVPPYMLATGVRGRLHGPNSIGLKRIGMSGEARRSLKNAYKIIFRSGLPKAEAMDKALAEYPDSKEVKNVVDFIRASSRGVTPDHKTPEADQDQL